MSDTHVDIQLPRIEDFRSDYTPDQIQAAEAQNTRAIAMQAYLYAFPAFLHLRQLTEIIQGRQYSAPAECPLGGWVLMRQLSDPATTTVSPNVDTLYGATYLLLDRQGPVVLTVPPIPGRYHSVAIMDAFFNNFAIVSPRTFDDKGGAYLLVPPGWNGTTPAGIRAVFQAPTPSICLVQRIYVRDKSEYPELHALQDAICLTPLDRWQQGTKGFPMLDLSEYTISGLRALRDPLQFFALTNAYLGVNLPPAEDAGLAALFQTAGVGPGSQLPSDPAARQVIAQGAADAQAVMNARISAGPFRRGWRVPDPTSGIAGGPILTRAAVQATQMELFPLVEATYFYAYQDADGQTLRGDGSYALTFQAGELPPLHEYGFWSLTMYGENSLLVANEIDRYCIRPDTPGLTYAADGSLTLRIQHVRPQDAPEGNWLPAPEGAFNVALRTYQPQAAIIDGTWFPPAIVRVS